MINKLGIKNFKNLHNVEAVLSRVNILAGINGRGKSSFLQSILVLSQSWRQGQTKMLLPSGCWKNLGTYSDIHNVYYSSEPLSFSIESDEGIEKKFILNYHESTENPAFGALESFTVDDKVIFDRSHDQIGNSLGESSSGSTETPNITLADVDDYSGLSQLKRVYYIPSDRKAASEMESYTPDVTYLKPDGSNVLSVLMSKGPDVLHAVETRMGEILEDAAVKLVNTATERRLLLNSVGDGNFYRPVNVGYGFGYIFTLVVASVLTKERDILIVENPEAHLHPSAQSKIMKILINDAMKKNVQLFVESHSDHIVNASLLAIKQDEISCTKEDVEILFFDSFINDDNIPECNISNLAITRSGKIMNPPRKFGDQYAIDLRALYRDNNRRNE